MKWYHWQNQPTKLEVKNHQIKNFFTLIAISLHANSKMAILVLSTFLNRHFTHHTRPIKIVYINKSRETKWLSVTVFYVVTTLWRQKTPTSLLRVKWVLLYIRTLLCKKKGYFISFHFMYNISLYPLACKQHWMFNKLIACIPSVFKFHAFGKLQFS